MFSRNRSTVSPSRQRAEDEIGVALSGGDSLPAWNAVWDLVQSSDSQGKQELLTTLKGYVDSAVSGESVAQAEEFHDAIEQRFQPPVTAKRVLPSREVRRQHEEEQLRSQQEAMRKIGVRRGEGLPMWAIYMTRRNKRSWG